MAQWLECPTLSSNFPPEKVHGLRVTGSNPGTGKKNGKKKGQQRDIQRHDLGVARPPRMSGGKGRNNDI